MDFEYNITIDFQRVRPETREELYIIQDSALHMSSINSIRDNPAGAETFRFLEDILKGDTDLRVRVTGRSMAPFLNGGDVVTIRKVRPFEVRRGDLIFFRGVHGGHILHRVVRKRRGDDGTALLQTKGDAVASLDHPVRYEDVLGRVCLIERDNCSSGKNRLDLDSALWRKINFLFAMIHLTRAGTRSLIYTLAVFARVL
jgi:signal peptidase I